MHGLWIFSLYSLWWKYAIHYVRSFAFSKFRLVEIFFAYCIIVFCLLNSDWANSHYIMSLRLLFTYTLMFLLVQLMCYKQQVFAINTETLVFENHVSLISVIVTSTCNKRRYHRTNICWWWFCGVVEQHMVDSNMSCGWITRHTKDLVT